MTSYTALKQTYTPGAVSSDATQYVFGLSFKVTSPGIQLDGWWWWCDITNGQGNAAEDFALWQSTGTGTGTYVAGSKVTSGNFSQGWNFIACSPAIPLTSGQEYRAVKTTNKTIQGIAYTAVGHFFDTGGGSAGAVNGPLTVFAAPTTGTNPEPHGDAQMVFIGNAADVTVNYPSGGFNSSWYGMDVQVSDTSSSAALTAPGVLTAAGVVSKLGVAPLAASPALTAASLVTEQASALLAAPAALTVAGVVSKVGQAALAASPVLTAIPPGAAVQAGAALSAGPVLQAFTHVYPDGLWAIYVAAAEAAAAQAQTWRMYRSLTGGTSQAGFQYGAAFEAENAADQAYQNWQAAYRKEFPGSAG